MADPAALDDCARLDPRAFYNLRMQLVTAPHLAVNADGLCPGLHARLEYRPTPYPDGLHASVGRRPGVPLPCGRASAATFALGPAYRQARAALGFGWEAVLIGTRVAPGRG